MWLDGLDIPMVRILDAGFAEKRESAPQEMHRPEGDALARYGSNMLPVDYYPIPCEPARVFVYPFERTQTALRGIAHSGAPDPYHGFKLRYVNPATGSAPMPTIGAFAQLLPGGFETKPYRCTDGGIYVCLEGAGEVQIESTTWRFEESDVFVVPSWHITQLRANRACLLFSFSDRPIHQALGMWREQRL
jgi:gentisate 1,2-dioxygenase